MNRTAAWLLGGAAGLFLLSALRGRGSAEEEAQEEEMPSGSTELPPFPALEVASGKYLAVTAAQAYFAMQAAARAASVDLPISTAWRSRVWQQRLYDAWVAFQNGTGPVAAMAAKPGSSYHEKGIALDLSGLNPNASNYNPTRAAWLQANASKFGWYNTGAYFKNKEPWHWVYGVQREGV